MMPRRSRRYSTVWISVLIALGLSAAAGAESVEFTLAAVSAESYGAPHDIVLSPDGKRLFVADNTNNRIAVLDSRTLKAVGSFGKGELSEPHDVAFDTRGRLLVADTGNDRIAIYEIEGVRARLVGALRDRIRRPEGVAAHPDGRVFATGAASDNLVVYQNGRVLAETGGFSSPHDVEFGPEGAVWIADAGNDRMVRLNADLKIAQVLTGSPYDFKGPRYLDFDSAGRMFVADKYTHRIKVIAPDGRLLAVLGRDAGKGEGRFDRPEGVELREGEAWFSDTYNDRIVRYDFKILP